MKREKWMSRKITKRRRRCSSILICTCAKYFTSRITLFIINKQYVLLSVSRVHNIKKPHSEIFKLMWMSACIQTFHLWLCIKIGEKTHKFSFSMIFYFCQGPKWDSQTEQSTHNQKCIQTPAPKTTWHNNSSLMLAFFFLFFYAVCCFADIRQTKNCAMHLVEKKSFFFHSVATISDCLIFVVPHKF